MLLGSPVSETGRRWKAYGQQQVPSANQADLGTGPLTPRSRPSLSTVLQSFMSSCLLLSSFDFH